MQAAIVLTVSVLANPGTPSRRMWPFASRPSNSRSTRYFWPITTRPTCSRKGGIHCPISWTCCVISCVDFIRKKVRQVRREDRSINPALRLLAARSTAEKHRQPGERPGRADPSLEISRISVAQELRLIDKENDLGRLECFFVV